VLLKAAQFRELCHSSITNGAFFMKVKRIKQEIVTEFWWRNLLESGHVEDQVRMGGWH
jgi:hypothetical protein